MNDFIDKRNRLFELEYNGKVEFKIIAEHEVSAYLHLKKYEKYLKLRHWSEYEFVEIEVNY